MAKTGIAIPFQGNGTKRIRMIGGNSQLRKIILLNLGDLESKNPFQDGLGLGGDLIFSVSDEQLRAELRLRIEALFRRLQLQDRARLAKIPEFTIDSKNMELKVDISYINIEENREEDLEINFSTVPDADAEAALIGALRT